MRYFLLILLLLATSSVFSQSYKAKENNVWVFGAFEGLDFNKKPVEDKSSTAFNFYAIGSVCDTAGKLQFYTEGTNVFTADGSMMPNGAEVTPGTYSYLGSLWTPTDQSVHGVQIIPVPGAPKKYYVFTVLGYYQHMKYGWNYYWGILYYTMVDMSLNGGKGDVVPNKKAIRLDSGIAMPLAGVVAEKCNTYWLVAHDRYFNKFRSYNITDTGIDTVPVISTTGAPGAADYGYGSIVISPDRKKLAFCSYLNNEGNLQVMDFNAATGVVSNATTMQGTWADPSAAAFSPDNTKLYMMNSVPSPYPSFWGGATVSIAQYNLSGATPTVPVIIGGSGSFTAELRLGPDGKIYSLPYTISSGTPNGSLARIEFPNVAGVKCTYTPGVLPFRYGYAITPFPNEVPTWSWKYERLNTSSSLNICYDDSAELKPINVEGEEYKWENGIAALNRIVDTTGTYVVSYNNSTLCRYYSDTFKVKELDSVQMSLGPDTAICDQQAYILKSDTPAVAYLWSDGSTAETYTVNNTGIYWLQVTTKDGCLGTDTVVVNFIDLAQHLGNDTIVCSSDMLNLRLQANVPDGATTMWSTGSTDPSIMIADTGSYSVRVSYGLQCFKEDTLHIAGKSCNCHVSMPTGFTPNGDGKNDRYRAVLQPGCVVQSITLRLYNRWGQLVFTSSNPGEGWDGNFNGIPCDIGTYLYVLEGIIGDDNKSFSQKGDMQLIR